VTFPPERVGRYRLLRPIGSGGMGEVYLAQFESAVGVRRLAAVKLVRNALSSPQTQRGLLAEARLAALITHPNIVQVFDADLEDGVPWFAVEFVPGLSLAELMALVDGPLPPWTAARIVADLAAAAHAVHEAVDQQGKALDVVHRDITPHNVLLSWEGVVKLSDFGVARSSLQSSFTRDGVIKGKLGYMSPEQAGGGAIDRRSDIFSLGVVLWELVAGRSLFLGGTNAEVLASTLRCEIPRLVQVQSSLPESLSEIAEAALQREPGARFATAQELERALRVALARSGFVVGAAELGQ
jgi:serine/threonine protein kinase